MYEHHCCGDIFINTTALMVNVKGLEGMKEEEKEKSPCEDSCSVQRGPWVI